MDVAVLGASPDPERYSNKAVRMLAGHGHRVVPVNPGHRSIEGLVTAATLSVIPAGSIDTVTVYVGAARSAGMTLEFLALRPRRVIFNPGAENPELAAALKNEGIEVEDTCTLVLLQTGQF